MQIFVPEISHYLLQYLLFYLQVFMYVCVYTTVDRWESEDTLQGLLFSLHYAWYRDRTQVVKFDSKEALLPGTNLFLKKHLAMYSTLSLKSQSFCFSQWDVWIIDI